MRNILHSMPPFTVKVRYCLVTVPFTVSMLQVNAHKKLSTQGYNILMVHHKRTLNLGNSMMCIFSGGRGYRKEAQRKVRWLETKLFVQLVHKIKRQFYDHDFSIKNCFYVYSDFIREVIGCEILYLCGSRLFTALYYCLLKLYIISTKSAWLNQLARKNLQRRNISILSLQSVYIHIKCLIYSTTHRRSGLQREGGLGGSKQSRLPPPLRKICPWNSMEALPRIFICPSNILPTLQLCKTGRVLAMIQRLSMLEVHKCFVIDIDPQQLG